MGLDIGFNRKAAEKAGLVFKTLPNDGTYDEDDDPEYISWCKDSHECIAVPNTDHYVSNDSGSDEHVVVRANRWGSTYYPLTAWLTDHGITWDEF
jgi:hypothetical protein